MSRIRVERITDKQGTGAPLFPNGISVVGLTSLSNVVSGIVTASQLFGDGSNLTGVTATDVGTLSSLNVTGNVSIGGTLTYEDVTNIDSVGVITARDGIKVTGGNILLTGGNNTKVSFAGDGSSHYIKMDTTLNGPVINGYGGIAFETFGANERLRIGSAGQIGLGGANYGTSGQVLTSQGASAAPQWASPSGTETLISTTNMDNQNNFTLTGLDFTTYPRGYRFVANNFNIHDSGGNWQNGQTPRFRLGTSGGIITTSGAYGYHSIEQRVETQNIDQSAQDNQDEVRISNDGWRWFNVEIIIYPADLSGSPANGSGTGDGGYPAQFSVKTKYLRRDGSNYTRLACMNLEGGMHLANVPVAQIDRFYIRCSSTASMTFNSGTMRMYGLK